MRRTGGARAAVQQRNAWRGSGRVQHHLHGRATGILGRVREAQRPGRPLPCLRDVGLLELERRLRDAPSDVLLPQPSKQRGGHEMHGHATAAKLDERCVVASQRPLMSFKDDHAPVAVFHDVRI